jgi:type II secretory pathway component GspD/PulD (secretin)
MRCCLAAVVCAAAPPGTWAQEEPAAELPEAGSEVPDAASGRISLDLKGVDIVDVLKLLSQKGSLNFVAGRNVSGRVTIFAKDVDIWEAFKLIVSANDLAYEIRGDLINVMTARDYELIYGQRFQEPTKDVVLVPRFAKVAQVSTVLNQIKSAVGRVVADEASNTLVLTDIPTRLGQMQRVIQDLDRPTESRVYALNYSEAEKLQEKLAELLSPIGVFNFDARSNKVVVTDLPEVLAKTDQLIQAFDVPDGQVLIEAKIIKVELSDDNSFGIDWQRVLGGISAETRSNYGVLSDIIGESATGTGTALRVVSANDDARLVLEALQTLGNTETLSNPRIMVSNNQEARILVGTKEASVTTTTTVPSTGTVVSSPQIQYVDVGTKLYVTPNVKKDGRVQLKIRPEVSTATIEEFGDNRIPIVTTTEAETNVLVKSGVTLIIGGLIDTQHSRDESKLPIIGNIPFVGAPFRSLIKTVDRTELVVFLTPQIILSDGTPYEATIAREQGDGAASAGPGVPAHYQQTIRRHLQALFARRFREENVSQAGSVSVAFILAKTGRLVSVESVTSPQGMLFERLAKEALMKTGDFPAFPNDAQPKELRFQIAVDYVPPESPD